MKDFLPTSSCLTYSEAFDALASHSLIFVEDHLSSCNLVCLSVCHMWESLSLNCQGFKTGIVQMKNLWIYFWLTVTWLVLKMMYTVVWCIQWYDLCLWLFLAVTPGGIVGVGFPWDFPIVRRNTLAVCRFPRWHFLCGISRELPSSLTYTSVSSRRTRCTSWCGMPRTAWKGWRIWTGGSGIYRWPALS